MILSSILLLVAHTLGANVECGVRSLYDSRTRHSRIIGGQVAEVGEFPWQVSIQERGHHFCGGSILSEWWILTVAHCFYSEISPSELTVIVGTNDLSTSSMELLVTTIIRHKNFQRLNMDNDIALLLLAKPIKFNDLTVPICLPLHSTPSSWYECWVAGWGLTDSEEKASMTTDLMKVPMRIIEWEACVKVFPKLTKNMLCGTYDNESFDACQGDSGGPLVCSTEPGNRWYQVGIISWGKSCGQKDTPGIYTMLSNYTPWIEKIAQIEGKSLDAKPLRVSSKEKTRGNSQSSKCPAPGCPQSWLLPCLLSFVLFRALSNWE